MVKNNKELNIEQFNIDLKPNMKNGLFAVIVLALICLLFRKTFNIHIERILLLIILYCLLLVLTKNWMFSTIGTIILFSLFNLMMVMQLKKKHENIENFDNEKKDVKEDIETKKEEIKAQLEDSDILKQITAKMSDYENDPNVQKAAGGIQELMKKLDGGIELKDSDTKETEKMDISTKEYEDEKKNYPLKKAQQEVYELVNTIDTLKNTIDTLAPVLSQGKELMGMFENFKL